MIKIGLENFIENHKKYYQGSRLGLLANQASVDKGYRHCLDLLDEHLPKAVKKLFNPQHGWGGEKQDNMVESDHSQKNHRPIFSLYGETRVPTDEMFSELDALVVDLVDVGTRVYTFAQTLSYCLEKAGKLSLEVIILDRPNPIGGEIEGNLLDDDCLSFVGLHKIPMRHGLSLGELAIFINQNLKIPATLTVIPCLNWSKNIYFSETSLPWVWPSPNMPSFETAWVYPGQVIWEGTNVSEARGTTRPFNLVGAPYINADILYEELRKKNLPGIVFRKAVFQPTFHKWAGEVCQGVELYPVAKDYKPYLTSLTILEIILKFWPNDFKLKEPPYEYEYHRRPIDLILGRKNIFDRLLNGETAASLSESWLSEENIFRKKVKLISLYN